MLLIIVSLVTRKVLFLVTVLRCTKFMLSMAEKNRQSKDEFKSNQWFGATLSTSEDGLVVACAPLYSHFVRSYNTPFDIQPIGTCHISKGYSIVYEYSPCRSDITHQKYENQMCQFGFSASFSKNGKMLILGSVGWNYWRGKHYSVDTNHDLNYYGNRKIYSEFHRSRYTQVTSNFYDNNGYSVTTGNFGERDQIATATGMPKGAKLFGQVVIYSSDGIFEQILQSKDYGAYFGYCIASADFNGDGFDDLIIGAPFYSDFKNKDGSYDNGRVYFLTRITNVPYRFYKNWVSRTGQFSKGRFGLALTTLGDVNRDGFSDIAIGAPYEEQGAVYIYLGSSNGIRENPSQIIRAEQLSNSINTFGFSLDGGKDLDINSYPDLVVGAYGSETAHFFRAKHVVTIQEAYLKTNIKNNHISLDANNCVLKNSRSATCFVLEACLEQSTIIYNPANEGELYFNLELILDFRENKSPRMFFKSAENQFNKTVLLLLKRNRLTCIKEKVYITPDISDRLAPLKMEMKISLNDEKIRNFASSGNKKQRFDRILLPVIDPDHLQSVKSVISIQHNCGKDNICLPDLQLDAKSSLHNYLLGSKDVLWIDVTVKNLGEDAFESILHMILPLGIRFVKFEPYPNETAVSVGCSTISSSNNSAVECEIGNPLPSKKSVHFKILLQPFSKEDLTPEYVFLLNVYSSNPGTKTTMNFRQVLVNILIESSISLSGSSSLKKTTSSLVAKESNVNKNEIIHEYIIKNKGPSNIVEAEVNFFWSSAFKDGNPLLNLLKQPETKGYVICEPIKSFDEIKFKKNNMYHIEDNQIEADDEKELTFYSESYLNTSTISKGLYPMMCSKTICSAITCSVHNLDNDKEATIALHFFTSSSLLLKFPLSSEIEVSSVAVGHIIKLPYNGEIKNSSFSYEIKTTIYQMPPPQKIKIPPLWIYVLSVFTGVGIIIALVYLLYKVGFFKRNRPQSESPQNTIEKEVANKNEENARSSNFNLPHNPENKNEVCCNNENYVHLE
ncbi:integrin alpha-PS2-like isoform X2 [Lycorma delicatula]|uniref:integrin alpha-PS2-like isoform X2 n=1 Tax=Lycorma delicatula TaxID=130591 RepID=UPI003F51410A